MASCISVSLVTVTGHSRVCVCWHAVFVVSQHWQRQRGARCYTRPFRLPPLCWGSKWLLSHISVLSHELLTRVQRRQQSWNMAAASPAFKPVYNRVSWRQFAMTLPERCSVCQLLQTLCILMAWTSPTESRPLIRLKGLSCGVKRLAVTPSLSVYEFSASIDCLLCFCLLRVLCLIPIAIFLVIIAFGLCFGEGKPQKNRKECQLTWPQGHAKVTLMQEKF